MSREHRRHHRYDVDLPARIVEGRSTTTGQVRNVSFDGLLVVTKTPPPVRKLLRMEVTVAPDEEPIRVTAMAVHIAKRAEGEETDVGIQLFGLAPEIRQQWDRFIVALRAAIPAPATAAPASAPPPAPVAPKATERPTPPPAAATAPATPKATERAAAPTNPPSAGASAPPAGASLPPAVASAPPAASPSAGASPPSAASPSAGASPPPAAAPPPASVPRVLAPSAAPRPLPPSAAPRPLAPSAAPAPLAPSAAPRPRVDARPPPPAIGPARPTVLDAGPPELRIRLDGQMTIESVCAFIQEAQVLKIRTDVRISLGREVWVTFLDGTTGRTLSIPGRVRMQHAEVGFIGLTVGISSEVVQRLLRGDIAQSDVSITIELESLDLVGLEEGAGVDGAQPLTFA